MANLERSKTRVKGFKDAEMDFQLMRQLGSCTYGGASVGECLALVDRIEDGDPARQFGAFCEGVGGPVALHRFTRGGGRRHPLSGGQCVLCGGGVPGLAGRDLGLIESKGMSNDGHEIPIVQRASPSMALDPLHQGVVWGSEIT